MAWYIWKYHLGWSQMPWIVAISFNKAYKFTVLEILRDFFIYIVCPYCSYIIESTDSQMIPMHSKVKVSSEVPGIHSRKKKTIVNMYSFVVTTKLYILTVTSLISHFSDSGWVDTLHIPRDCWTWLGAIWGFCCCWVGEVWYVLGCWPEGSEGDGWAGDCDFGTRALAVVEILRGNLHLA